MMPPASMVVSRLQISFSMRIPIAQARMQCTASVTVMRCQVPCRSLLIAQELLNTKEIVLMHHTGKALAIPLNFRASPAAHHSPSLWLLDGRELQCACPADCRGVCRASQDCPDCTGIAHQMRNMSVPADCGAQYATRKHDQFLEKVQKKLVRAEPSNTFPSLHDSHSSVQLAFCTVT
jgi:hypothetical protein